MKFILRFLFFLLSTMTLSCQSLMTPFLKSPQMALSEFKLNKVTLTGMSFNALFKATNPNSTDIKVDEIFYELSVGEKPLFSGNSKNQILLPANKETVLELPIEIKYNQVEKAFEQIINRQKTDFKFSGYSKVGLFSIPFQKTGELDLPIISY